MAQLSIELSEYDALRNALSSEKERSKKLEDEIKELKKQHTFEISKKDNEYKKLESEKRVIVKTITKFNTKRVFIDNCLLYQIKNQLDKLYNYASNTNGLYRTMYATEFSPYNCYHKIKDLIDKIEDSNTKNHESYFDRIHNILNENIKITYNNFEDVKEELLKDIEKEYKDKNSSLKETVELQKDNIFDLKKKHQKEIDDIKNKVSSEKELLKLTIFDLQKEFDAYKEDKMYEEDLLILKRKSTLLTLKLKLIEGYNNKPWYSKSQSVKKHYKKSLQNINDELSDLDNAYEDTDSTRYTRRKVLEGLCK